MKWRTRIVGGVLFCLVGVVGFVLYIGKIVYEPIVNERSSYIRLANEQGVAVRQVTRFAGEEVVWTVEGTQNNEGILLMFMNHSVTRIPLKETIVEQEMRRTMAQSYPQWMLVRLVRGRWQEEWVWEAWLRKGTEVKYVYTRLRDGRLFKTYTLSTSD